MATLQDQALGAFVNHAQIQNPPPQRLLDDLAAFQQVLFTNRRGRELSEAVTAGMPLPDPDPPLNEFGTAGQGRVRMRVRALPRRSGAVDDAAASGSISRHQHTVPASREIVIQRGRTWT
jgi:hypothetical protein